MTATFANVLTPLPSTNVLSSTLSRSPTTSFERLCVRAYMRVGKWHALAMETYNFIKQNYSVISSLMLFILYKFIKQNYSVISSL